jgi:signal transduction histidine kinase
MAVIAHALLNSLSVISGSTELLLEHDDLPPATRTDLLERIHNQAIHVSGVLQDLVRGLPVGVQDALQALTPSEDRSPASGRRPGK